MSFAASKCPRASAGLSRALNVRPIYLPEIDLHDLDKSTMVDLSGIPGIDRSLPYIELVEEMRRRPEEFEEHRQAIEKCVKEDITEESVFSQDERRDIVRALTDSKMMVPEGLKKTLLEQTGPILVPQKAPNLREAIKLGRQYGAVTKEQYEILQHAGVRLDEEEPKPDLDRRDFIKGTIAGAVVAAIAAIGVEELRMAGRKTETITETSTATQTTTQTSTATQTSTVTSMVPTTETTTVTTQVGTVIETSTVTTTSPVTTTSTTTVPTTVTRTVTSTTTVGEVPVVGLVREITLNVNGEDYKVEVENRTSLLEVLNNSLQLTRAKDGCDQGECGSCTVLVDGVPTLSCMVLTVEQVGKSIETVVGLAPSPDSLHPIQQAFFENDDFQCGFCTSGMILATKALLERVPSPTIDDIKYYLGGNLCKCGAYPHIVDSVLAAAGG